MRDSEKAKEKIAQLNIIDDVLFQKMAEDIGFCEETISTAMEQKVKVLQVIPQNFIKNLQGRSVIVDALCELEDGRTVDVEVQKANDDDHQRRVRYNAACITANITDTGERFENVPDVVVIYISEFDMFQSGKTVYHIDRTIRENGKVVYNGMTEIYINTKIDDGSDIAKLMKIYTETDAYDYERFPNTSARKAEFKRDEGGRKMSNLFHEIVKEYAEEMAQDYAKEIARDYAKEIARDYAKENEQDIMKRLLKKGMPVEEVIDLAKLLTPEEIRKLAE